MDCHLYSVPGAEETLHLLSPLSKAQLAGKESRSEFFLGRLIDPAQGADPGNISYNADFLVIVHELVRDTMVNHPDVVAEAESQLNGFVFIVDQRSPHNEEVQKEDIIGIFLVNENKTDVSRYRPNPDYRLIGKNGVAVFPDKIEDALIRRLLGS
jgi:hypothetical protein